MLLAEALMTRATYEKKLNELKARLARVVRVQEGDVPAEEPGELLTELAQVLYEQTGLVVRINRTNLAHIMPDGQTLMESIQERDSYARHMGFLKAVIEDAVPERHRWSSRSEVRETATISVKELQNQIDHLAAKRRGLDMQIQAANWTIEVLE